MSASKKKTGATSLSLAEKKALATSSLARQKAGLSPSKLNVQEVESAPTKQNLSTGLKTKGVSPSSPIPSMTLWRKYSLLPKAILFWVIYRIAKLLLKLRNPIPKVLIHPDKRLKRIALPVDFDKTTLIQRTVIIRKMGAALSKQTYGMKLGIAAPQIGINLRVMIVRGNVMFNPEWQPAKAPLESITEGCYSVPYKVFKVPRAKYGWAKWTNIEGRPMESKLSGLPAIVFQHELDHLNGICCADIGEEVKS